MPQSRLVTATYSTAAAASITMGKTPFCRYQPLRLVLIIDLTWTDVVWNRMFAILSRNLDIQDELIDMDHLYTDFRLLDNDTEIKRGIFFQKDIKAIAAPAIRLMEALTEFGPRYDTFVSNFAVGLVAFVALHQMILSQMREHIKNLPSQKKTKTLTAPLLIRMLDSLITVCRGRILSGYTSRALADVIVLAIKASVPPNPDLTSRFMRIIKSKIRFDSVVDTLLDNMYDEDFVGAQGLPRLIRLCDPQSVMASQLRAANIFIQIHGKARLTHGQQRALQLRPTLKHCLAKSCACGCKLPMPNKSQARACKGCRRAYYATPNCQNRHWPYHRDICIGIWQPIRGLSPGAEVLEDGDVEESDDVKPGDFEEEPIKVQFQ